ncbi:protein-(glutamine-N5) methyltransferase, release factor-specific [Solemya velum gill symbiont]|uniref:peptide chain release factor N(5)-glutamine methyltransferase n=1 Tax=Solemya velum gill symbiont TaxID=2340 RepID=UPI0009987C24|nr:peptide chain release factor N(5)-glutamine methyltransferase [Solemya velum gill symbiont]OOZ17180.1 protein-(glutamine-N5) methyltransferase, release factor-specific [Solemya velum gill symbiont]OOZ26834.1 protein-(glutamine-N5) methyltransferase, release factor-specific [Solemya velum gill symbiont]
MQVKELLQQATARLKEVTDTPALEARLLLAHLLDKSESWLIAWPEHQPTADQQARFEQLLEQRLQGKPIAHLLSHRSFWTLELKVTPDVLIPRPDTETVIETLLNLFDDQSRLRILDLGTGTGAIALALASERKQWEIHASDISDKALDVARENAARHHLDIRFHQGSWFETIPDELRFDLLVSNPPYICENDPHLVQGDVRFEPQLALTSGPDGLNAIRQLVREAPAHLAPGGMLMFEHGYDQAEDVTQLFDSAGFNQIETSLDHGGNQRVTFGTLA